MRVLLGTVAALVVAAVVAVALADDDEGPRSAIAPTAQGPTSTATAEPVDAPTWVLMGPDDPKKPFDYVVAASGAEVWRLSLSLTDDPSAFISGWTMDGRAIVEVRRGGNAFYFSGIPGQALGRTSSPVVYYGSTMLSGDGRYVAELVGATDAKQQEVVVRDAVTLEKLATLDVPQNGLVSWSGDGEFLSIAFPIESKTVIWDWKDNERREMQASRSAWSHRGARLAYVPQPFPTSPGVHEARIVIRDVGSGTETEAARTRTGSFGFLAWSTDDTALSFSSTGDRGHETLLIDTTGHRAPLRVTGSFMETWEPSGDRLAFVGNWCSTFDIFTVSKDGSDLRKVTGAAGGGLGPAWSPDGSAIAYARSPGPDRAGMAVIDLSNGRSRPVLDIPAGAALSVIGWSPDGRYFAVNSGGGKGLCEGRPEGGEATTVEVAS